MGELGVPPIFMRKPLRIIQQKTHRFVAKSHGDPQSRGFAMFYGH